MKERLERITLKQESITLACYTKKQREAIRARDHYKCQFPPHLNGHRDECKGPLQVHHIKPQRYLKNFGVDPDYPENGITVCSNGHNGVDPNTSPERVIHPDVQTARIIYQTDKESYNKAFEERDKCLQKGVIYWNDSYDRSMEVIAVRNTQRAKEKKWNFPVKHGKKQTHHQP